MKLLCTFVPYPDGSYHVAFLCEDAQTPFGRQLIVRDPLTLIRVVVRLRGDGEVVRHALKSWGQGSAWISPTRDQVEWIERG